MGCGKGTGRRVCPRGSGLQLVRLAGVRYSPILHGHAVCAAKQGVEMRGRRESGLRGNLFDGQPRIPQLETGVLKPDSPQLLGDPFAKHLPEAEGKKRRRIGFLHRFLV